MTEHLRTALTSETLTAERCRQHQYTRCGIRTRPSEASNTKSKQQEHEEAEPLHGLKLLWANLHLHNNLTRQSRDIIKVKTTAGIRTSCLCPTASLGVAPASFRAARPIRTHVQQMGRPVGDIAVYMVYRTSRTSAADVSSTESGPPIQSNGTDDEKPIRTASSQAIGWLSAANE